MLTNIETVVFDLDGTIYYGDKVIEGVTDVLDYINKKGLNVYYLTNNSTKSRQEIYNRLKNMGIDVDINQVYTSSYIAALYAKEKNLDNVFVLGSDGLKAELRLQGICVTECELEAHNLLIGYDTELDYEKLTKALNVALKGNPIIACNKERHFPGKNARRFPGCGAMVGAIELCTNREVDYVVGKPNPLMLEILAKENQLNPKTMIMVGDTYESDILMAHEFGCRSILIDKNYMGEATSVEHIYEIIKDEGEIK